MKKCIVALSVVLMMMLSFPANAVDFRLGIKLPSLTFEDKTATCKVLITTENSSDDISATITLWNGSSCIKTWNASDSGKLDFSQTATVVKGETYTLNVDALINGEPQETFSTTRTCPK